MTVVLVSMAIVADGAPGLARASAGPNITVIALADNAWVAGVTVGSGAVWVANGRTGTVSRIDPQTNERVATVDVAEPSPTCERCWGAVAARGDVVWATTNNAGPVVARIDPGLNRVTQSIRVEVLPSAFAVDEDGALWLTASLENAVVHVDPRLGRADARIDVHLPADVVAGKDTVWVTARKPGSDGRVVRINPLTDQVVATIPVGREPGALAVDEAGVWVANEQDHTVSRIDPRTNTVAATIPVVHQPVGVVIGDSAVWVASRGSALLSLPSISRIDPSTNRVVETTTIAETAPVSMVAGEGSLWVASRNPDELVRIGPVSLPASTPSADKPPVIAVTLGLGIVLMLAAAVLLRNPARRDRKRPQRKGQMLAALSEMKQQASRQADAQDLRERAYIVDASTKFRERNDIRLTPS